MMKEEEKLLLLEDISARLPFGLAFINKQAVVFVPKDEYEKMKELANANAEEIEKRALEMWETKAIPWLKVSMEIRSSGGRDILDSEEFEFRTHSYLLNPSGMFTIKEEARQRFDKMLTGWARHMMELQFGEHISKIIISTNDATRQIYCGREC